MVTMIMSELNCISLNVCSVIWEMVRVKGTNLDLMPARTHSETGILYLFAVLVRVSVTLVRTEISQHSHHSPHRTDPEPNWCWQVVLIREMTIKVDFYISLLQSTSTCLVRLRPLVAAVVITAVWKFGSFWQTTYSVVQVWGCVGGWWSFLPSTQRWLPPAMFQRHMISTWQLHAKMFSNSLICLNFIGQKNVSQVILVAREHTVNLILRRVQNKCKTTVHHPLDDHLILKCVITASTILFSGASSDPIRTNTWGCRNNLQT